MLYGYTLGMIGLLILIHELGHLTAACLAKIPVQTFSVGFGPRLAGFSWKGVECRLSLILLGGYLKARIGTKEEWSAIPLLRRIVFTLGGVIANGVAAVLSLNLAAINLLPLPALDGGRALFDILEKVVPPLGKASAGFSMAGWLVLIGLTLWATANDLARIFA